MLYCLWNTLYGGKTGYIFYAFYAFSSGSCKVALVNFEGNTFQSYLYALGFINHAVIYDEDSHNVLVSSPDLHEIVSL